MDTDRVMGSPLGDAAPEVTRAQVRAIAREVYGVEPRALRPLPGERDRNFHLSARDGRELVLKVVHPREDSAVTSFQTLALVHVARADPSLPVPRVLPARDGRVEGLVWATPGALPRRLRCVTYLPGVPLADVPAPTAARWRNLGSLAARLDLALAGYHHPAEDHGLLWDLKRAERTRGLAAAIEDPAYREQVERQLDRFAAEVRPRLATLRDQVIHNDLNPHNVCVAASLGDELTGVIDVGDMVRAPLVQELATAISYQLRLDGHPLAPAVEIAAAFDALLPLTDEEVALLPELIATRLALRGAITGWRAAQHPSNASYILRNQGSAAEILARVVALAPAAATGWLRERLEARR